jgi:malonyl-CoA/methylmalonyl-CoA synthetase
MLELAPSERICVLDANGAHTYRDIHEGALRVAAALSGTPRHERVALLVSPGAGFLHAFFGVLYGGGCVVVLSPLHPPAETSYFCDDAGVQTIVASPDLAEHARLPRRVLRVDEALAASPSGTPVRAGDDEPSVQLYTSGTTGKPKGAIITHGNLTTQQRLLREAWGVTERDVLLHLLPLHHMHGLAISLLTMLGAGAAVRMLPAFDAHATWEAMAECTVFMAVPTIYAKLLHAFDHADGPTRARWARSARALRLSTSGSAALPVSVGERWRALTGAYPLERFGMTEIGVGTTNPLHGDRRPGTVGRPLPTVETRVVGSPERGSGGDDAPGRTGELQVAGPSVFAGYHQRDEATRAAFVTDGATRWFKTGDTVAIDDDGYVRILGRTSVDILKSGGYKLSALEIEEALRAYDAIAEVAVVGVPDETWGDRVVACVVARSGREADCTEERVRAFAKRLLAPYKVPKEVVVLRELPRNAVGKVIKPELVKKLAAREPAR